MQNQWINPKIVIGNTATGEYYFPRPFIEESIWEEIKKGNHVLIAAPRRVGKSSVMQAMMDNYPENTRCVFANIQGIKSEDEYYQRFYELLIQCLSCQRYFLSCTSKSVMKKPGSTLPGLLKKPPYNTVPNWSSIF